MGLHSFRWKVALYMLFSTLSVSGCLNSDFYYPDDSQNGTPASYGLKYEDVFFESRDGTRLHGWFIPARGAALGTVIHFHGSFGNLSYSLQQVGWFASEGFNVFTFDYRGYGRSEGEPSRQGVHEDSVAAVRYIASRPGLNHDNLFVFGQSLGGAAALAAAAAAKKDIPQLRAVAVEGAFFSYRSEACDMMKSVVRKRVGDAPCLSLQIWAVSLLAVTDSHSSDASVGRLSPIPLLLIHCLQDGVVSYRHSQWLYEKAKQPKDLWLIDGCRHLRVFTDAQSEHRYRQRLVRFFAEHRQYASLR